MEKREQQIVLYAGVILAVALLISLAKTNEVPTGQLVLGGKPTSTSGDTPLPGQNPGDYDSGEDCTAQGGSSPGSGPGGTQDCEKAFNAACAEAKTKAQTEKGPKCNTNCIAAGYVSGSLTGCTCPLTGNNPDTGQPYTCFTQSPTGKCVANTVAQCTCTCQTKAKEIKKR